MRIVLSVLLVGVLLIISCNSETHVEKSNPDSVTISKSDTTIVKTPIGLRKEPADTGFNNEQQQAISDSIYYSIIQHAKIDILETRYTSSVDTLRDGADVVKMCGEWKKLSKKDLIDIFKKSEPINAFEFHYMFLVYPCSVEGRALVGDQEVSFSINAAATSYLQFPDGSIRLAAMVAGFFCNTIA